MRGIGLGAGSVSRFIFAVSAAFASAKTSNELFLLVVVITVMAAYLFWGAGVKDLLKAARYVAIFFIIVFALHLFSHPGRQVFEVWGLKATIEGAKAGIFYGIKLIAFVYAAFIIFRFVDPFELIAPIERTACATGSFGRFLSSFAIAFSLAMRFLPDLSRQSKTTSMALKSRGIDLRGNLFEKIRAASLILTSVMVHAFKKSESAAVALNVKGYSTRYKRAVFPPAKFGLKSVFVLSVSICMVGAGWLLK